MLDWEDSDSDADTICVAEEEVAALGEVETTSPAGEQNDVTVPELRDGIVPFVEEVPFSPRPEDEFGTVLGLELHNFKSYRGTVRITDFRKFTAIIGPNGCGKSNVMDAISFVLCVSSTILRGMNLKDFIYRSRKHDEEVTEAYVALTLRGANNPVVFKRHISSSGTVSYFVDDNAISFKQYNETLREYRINTLGSTGLIFQGAVNDIASRSPIELTRLFETISGSSLYARPYNYIKEKLERRRIEHRDLLSRKKSLQQELRQYRNIMSSGLNYDEILSNYKSVEAKKYACEFRIRQIKFNEKKQEYEHLLERHTVINEKFSSMQAKRDELERSRSSLYYEQSQIHRLIQEKRKQLLSKKEAMQSYDESKDSLEQQIAELEHLRQSLEEEVERLQGDHKDLCSQESELQSAVDADAKEIEKTKSYTVSMTTSQQERYDELLQSFNRETSAMRIRMNLRNSKMEALSSEQDHIKGELQALQRFQDKHRESARPHDNMHEALCTRLRETRDSMELLAMTKTRIESEVKQVGARKSALQSEKEELDEKLKTLNVAKVEYRQILRRSQYTQELMNSIPGVHGEVVTLFEITNACYHDGIMAALNTRSHTIVTDDLSTIQACIARLQKDKVFKRDFIPLDSLKQGKSDNRSRITEFFRTRGITVQYIFAIDCLVFQRKYASLFGHLLGDTIIVSNLDDAEKLIASDRGSLLSFNVVTQKGQVITRDRTIIIDSALYSKNSQIEFEIAEFGRLTLKAERLDHDIHLLSKKLTGAEASLQDTISKIQKHRRAVDLLQMKVDFSMKHKAASEAQLRETEEKIAALTSRLSSVDSELKSQQIEHDKDMVILDNMQLTHFKALNDELGVDNVYSILTARLDKVLKMESQLERKRAVLNRCTKDKKELENVIKRIKDESLPNTVQQHQQRLSELKDLLKGNQSLFRELYSLEKEVAADEERFEDYSRQIEKCHERIKLVQYEYDYFTDEGEEENGKSPSDADASSQQVNVNGNVSRVVPLSEYKEKISSKLVELLSSLKELQKGSIELSEQCKLKNVGCLISVPPSLLGSMDTEFVADFPRMENPELLEGVGNKLTEVERCASKLDNELQSLRKSLSASYAYDDADIRLQRAQVDSEHLEKQLDEVKKECDVLEADFDRIKKERSSLFMNCFQGVKRLVGPIYKSLSAQDRNDEMSGGTAFLSLEDDLSGSMSEPFLCSIRYNTMPPMKKFLDISLQSGGEKALSSLALLLALHSFRKSPFVVLDEIDANLDNVKVQSLVAYLQRCSFQVIIISLKPKLFSCADVLVGVYSKRDTASSNCVVLNISDLEHMSTSPQSIEQEI